MKYIKVVFRFLIKQLARFHRWIVEPLLLGVGVFASLQIVAKFLDHQGFSVLGWIWLLFLVFTRIWWLHGNLEKYLDG